MTLLHSLLLLLLFSGAAHAGPGALLADLKTKLVVDALRADGVQYYECRETGWFFRGPAAVLKDPRKGGKVLGTHGSCPTCGDLDKATPHWNLYEGGTLVAAKVDDVAVSGAIPELALEIRQKSAEAVRGATHVLRVQTAGGTAPASSECTADRRGVVRAVPYSATYQFVDSTRAAARSTSPQESAPASKSRGGAAE